MVSVVSIPDVCLLAYFYNNSWKMLCVFYFCFYSYSFLLYDNIFPNTKFVRYSDILLKKHKLHLSHLFCCNHTCCCINMVSVTSASRYIMSVSRYHPRYQSRSSMYISGPIPRNFAELSEAVPIEAESLVYFSLQFDLSKNAQAII